MNNTGSSPQDIIKVVRQSNHDSAKIPTELSKYADKPLYILIALWGMMQRDWIGNQQVSAAFAITERRASFQISYILRKKEQIRCQCRKVKVLGSQRLCHQIKVEQVNISSTPSIITLIDEVNI